MMIKQSRNCAHVTTLALQEQIDSVCDEFESDWRSGSRPRIEDYLKQVPDKDVAPLLRELLALEIDYRTKLGEEVTVESLSERFPQYPGVVAEVVQRERSSGWPAQPFRVPARIGDFELLDVLGEGAFGTVYRARDLELNRLVAIKLARVVASGAAVSRFLSEARHVAQLSHPGIVPVHSVGSCEHGPYIVSEFVEGPTLAEKLKAVGRTDASTAAELVAQLAEAVDYAHRHGVFHRDLKPSNILLAIKDSAAHAKDDLLSTGVYTPRVLDFGLARSEDADATLTTDGTVLGTPAYMSPEQARGDAHQADARSDLYSLGVILYELLCGHPPFTGARREVIRRVASEEVPSIYQHRRDVPKDLAVIVHHCLQRDPNRRYQRAAELAADLRRWRTGVPIIARPLSRAERSWLWMRRSWRWLSMATVAASIVLLLSAGLLWLSSSLENAKSLAADDLIHRLQVAPPEELPGVLARVRSDPDVRQRIHRLREEKQLPPDWRARLLLVAPPYSTEERTDLVRAMLDAPAEELLVQCQELRPFGHQLVPIVREWLAERSTMPASQWLRGACILAYHDSAEVGAEEFAKRLAASLVAEEDADASAWAELVRPAGGSLMPHLIRFFEEGERGAERQASCKLLVHLYSAEPDRLVQLLGPADAEQHRILLSELRRRPREVVPLLEQEAATEAPDGLSLDESEALARCRGHAAATLLALRCDAAWDILRFSEDPRAQTYFLHRAAEIRLPVRLLIDRLMREADPHASYLLLLALGDYEDAAFPAAERRRLNAWLESTYQSHPHPGVHAAAGWLLRQHGQENVVGILDEAIAIATPEPGREWYVNSLGMSMVFIDNPQPFRMGVAPDEDLPHDDERYHQYQIPWSYAVSATEVTWRHFRQYRAEHSVDGTRVPDADCPVVNISFDDVLGFCQWLNVRELGEKADGTVTRGDDGTWRIDFRKPGYRPLTGAEWEYACRAGTTTPRFFGTRRTPFVGTYAWSAESERELHRVALKAPNGLGLFDCYGNVHEWVAAPNDWEFSRRSSDLPVATFPPNSVVRIRGGAFDWRPEMFRAAWGASVSMTVKSPNIGFRIGRTLPAASGDTQIVEAE